MFAQVQARPAPNRTPLPTLRMTEGFLEDFIIVNPIEVDLMLCANFVIYQKLIRSLNQIISSSTLGLYWDYSLFKRKIKLAIELQSFQNYSRAVNLDGDPRNF